jgi:hypothetical protein
VTSQRQQFQDFKEGKPTPLTKQRKDLLDDIGFQWRVRNRPEWTSKFEELLTYKAKYGDTVRWNSWRCVVLLMVSM